MIFLSQNGATAASDVVIAVFSAVLTLISIIGLIVCLCRFAGNDGEVKNSALAFLLIFGAGFALRLVFALCVRGYRDDYALFTDMFRHLKNYGLNGYYDGDASVTLYPTVYFIYLIFGGLSNATGFSQYALGTQFMVKLPLIIADLLAALAIYKIANRYINKRSALALCAFVCVCPIFFVGSSLWCTPITFTVMFACFGCYCLAQKKYIGTIALMTAAAFSSKEGIYLFPAVCVFSVYHFVKAVSNIRRNKQQGESIWASEYRAAVTVPVGFVASVLGAYILGLFMIASYNSNPFVYIYEFLLAPLVGWTYFTYNGLSVYAIFNQNGSVPSARFPSWLFVCIFVAIITAVVCVVYFSKRNRATMVMLAAYSLFTMQTYYPGSTAISFQSVFIVLLAAYALVRDKRLLTVLFASGIVYVINSVTTLACAGYLNNLSDYNFGTESILLTGAMSAVPIACSVITVLAHLYFTVVTVSVGMTGQKKMLERRDGILPCLKEYFSIKKGM